MFCLDCEAPKPNTAQHFSAHVDHDQHTSYEDTGTLKCDTGYRVTGQANADTEVIITCTAHGNWSTEAITCEKKGTSLKSMFAYFNIVAVVH